VYLRVSPMKGVKRFGVKGKLAPCYIGPFPIFEKCGTVAYKQDLPPSLAGVHDIFHVLQLKKCLKPPLDVVLPEVTLLKADLSYPKHPIKVLDQKNCVTRRKTIKFFNIQWSNHSKREVTWESKNFLRSCHPAGRAALGVPRRPCLPARPNPYGSLTPVSWLLSALALLMFLRTMMMRCRPTTRRRWRMMSSQLCFYAS
jgi:hypothetical protein